MNLIKIVFCLCLGIMGCTFKKTEKDANYKMADGFGSLPKTSCDSVSGRGVSFVFEDSLGIDSVTCLKNSSKLINTGLFKENNNSTVIIYDTFLYENKYRMTLFLSNKQKIVSLRNIRFKSTEVYHGFYCKIKSCVFDGKIIKADAGSFYISNYLLLK